MGHIYLSHNRHAKRAAMCCGITTPLSRGSVVRDWTDEVQSLRWLLESSLPVTVSPVRKWLGPKEDLVRSWDPSHIGVLWSLRTTHPNALGVTISAANLTGTFASFRWLSYSYLHLHST